MFVGQIMDYFKMIENEFLKIKNDIVFFYEYVCRQLCEFFVDYVFYYILCDMNIDVIVIGFIQLKLFNKYVFLF